MSELTDLIYEVEHNSCKRIGEERYKRINQRIGYLKVIEKIFKEIDVFFTGSWSENETKISAGDMQYLTDNMKEIQKRASLLEHSDDKVEQ